jgi:hypothetical protein
MKVESKLKTEKTEVAKPGTPTQKASSKGKK